MNDHNGQPHSGSIGLFDDQDEWEATQRRIDEAAEREARRELRAQLRYLEKRKRDRAKIHNKSTSESKPVSIPQRIGQFFGIGNSSSKVKGERERERVPPPPPPKKSSSSGSVFIEKRDRERVTWGPEDDMGQVWEKLQLSANYSSSEEESVIKKNKHKEEDETSEFCHLAPMLPNLPPRYPASSIHPEPSIFLEECGMVRVRSDKYGDGGWTIVPRSDVIWDA